MGIGWCSLNSLRLRDVAGIGWCSLNGFPRAREYRVVPKNELLGLL